MRRPCMTGWAAQPPVCVCCSTGRGAEGSRTYVPCTIGASPPSRSVGTASTLRLRGLEYRLKSSRTRSCVGTPSAMRVWTSRTGTPTRLGISHSCEGQPAGIKQVW